MTCTPLSISVDLAASGWFTFTCTVSTQMSSAFAANVDWETTTSIVGEASGHFITFTSATGNTQTVTFSGTAKNVGNHQLLLSAREPGADYPMDTVTVVISTTDSNAPVETVTEDGGSALDALAQNSVVQAATGGLVLFLLMGLLMIRGRSKNARENERRMVRANELRQQRGITEMPRRNLVQQAPKAPRNRDRSSSMFSEFKRQR